MALVVVGAELPAEEWDAEISDLLALIGWRMSRGNMVINPSALSPTLSVLDVLGFGLNPKARKGVNPALAALARAAVRGR